MEDRKYWITIVDDDPVSLQQVKDLLSGQGLKVSSVRSGKELLVFIKKNRPDLILMDVIMPEIDGFEAFQKLREYEDKEERSHIPVIFLTGENDEDVEKKGLMIGASDFIRKPINREVLTRRVFNIINNRRTIEDLTEEVITDKLTGFYSKSYAVEKMTRVCKEHRGILMILDLDNFKLINDIYGHEMGDKALTAFADVARRNCRSKDILCRIGGDEFLVFFMDANDEHTAFYYVERLNEQLIDECIALMGEEFDVPIGVSMGCVPVEGKEDYEELFRLADKALYQVKQTGKHGCQFYDIRQQPDEDSFVPEQEIQRMITLCSERGRLENAMMLGQEAFISVYRYMNRFAKRHNEVLSKVIVYLETDENTDKEELMEAMSLFGNVLQNSFRKNDVITKSRSNCYFLLLSEYDKQDEQLVLDRMMSKWSQTEFADKFKVSYVVKK